MSATLPFTGTVVEPVAGRRSRLRLFADAPVIAKMMAPVVVMGLVALGVGVLALGQMGSLNDRMHQIRDHHRRGWTRSTT